MSDYPSLPSVRRVPVHSGLAGTDDPRWACLAYARDGTVDEVRYDWRCHGCVTAAEARLAQDGDRTLYWRPDFGPGKPEVVTLSWLVARAHALDDEAAAAVAMLAGHER